MNERLSNIEKCIVKIQQDIEHHIKRTDTLQNMVQPVYKLYIFLTYLMATLMPISIMVGLYLTFKG